MMLMTRIFGGAIVALLLLAGLQTYRLDRMTGQRDRAVFALTKARDDATIFAERVRSTAETTRANMIDAARRQERRQTEITQEVSHEYQNRLAELRARYARGVRPDTAGSARPRGGGAGVPGPAAAPGGLDATAAFNCEANRLQLEWLQAWVRRQFEVPRTPVPTTP